MDAQTFTQTYGPLASDMAAQTGLDPSVILGVAAQETGYGEHIAGNNWLGISPEGQVASYPDVQAGAKAFVDLMNSKRYASVASGTSPDAQAIAVQLHGYNPDKGYGLKIADHAAQIRPYLAAATAPSTDELLKMRGPDTPQPEATPSGPSVDELLKLRGPDPVVAPATTVPATATPAPSAAPVPVSPDYIPGVMYDPNTPPMMSNSGLPAGFSRGVHDVIDAPVEFLARNIGGTDEGTRVTAADQAAKKDFETNYGNDTGAEVGRIGGQLAVTIPATIGGNALLLKAATKVAPAAVQAVGDAINSATHASGASGVVARLGMRAVEGAGLGGEAGGLVSDQSDESFWDRVKRGMTVGAGVGTALGSAAAMARGLVAPYIERRFAELGKLAKDTYGIDLSVPQMGNRTLQSISGGTENPTFQVQLNRAIQKQMGVNGMEDHISPTTMSLVKSRVGQTMDKVQNNTNVVFGQDVIDKLAQVESDFNGLPEFPAVKRLLDGVTKGVQTGDTMPGSVYGDLVRTGSTLDRATNSSAANVADAASRIKETLQDALEQTLQNQGPAGEKALAEYQAARGNYKVMKTIEPLLARSPTGDIDPEGLMTQVIRKYGVSGVANEPRGATPMIDLARIGQLNKLALSGKSESWLGMLGHIAGVAAALGGYTEGGLLHGAAGLMTGEMLPHVGGKVLGAFYNSPTVAGNAIRRALTPSNPLMYQTMQPGMTSVPGVVLNNQLYAPQATGSRSE